MLFAPFRSCAHSVLWSRSARALGLTPIFEASTVARFRGGAGGDVAETLGIVLAAAVGAISGILTTTWKTRKDLESQYDIDLRKSRVDAYTKLWGHLEPLADYSPAAELTYDALSKLSQALRTWYFTTGGLFLSSQTRAPYFHLQQALTALTTSHDGPGGDVLSDDTSLVVRTLGSRLRTSTTEDVATRVGPRLGPSLLFRVGRSWRRFRPVRGEVDRRWTWEGGGAKPAYFVLVTNRSDREIAIVGLELEGVPDARFDPELPLLVQAGEPREVAVEVGNAGEAGRVVGLTITLSNGRRVRSKDPPDVPIRTDVLGIDSRRSAP